MAGRIPQHFLDELLNRVDIVDLIDSYVPLKKAGANYKACCPFHNEKTPSFTVSQDKQFYHCFGCGANGTAISFLMDYDHMEFREAVEKLASSAGMDIPEEAQSAPKPNHQGVDLYVLMQRISEHFQAQLRQHPQRQQAIDYLQNRGLSGEVAKQFSLGFAPDGWDNVLKTFGQTPAELKALKDVGMLSENQSGKTYDRFRNRIMFPIHDHRGRIVGFGGRVMGQGEPKYLNSPETPIFHKGSELYGLYAARGGIKAAEGVLVVEGYMDVVALAQNQILNAVATLGTATTNAHLQRLFRHTTNVCFCFDGDRAGRDAAWKALQTSLPLLEDGRQISFLFLPDGEDPDSMVRQQGQAAFLELVKQAQPLTDVLIDTLRQQADISRLDGRARFANLAKQHIERLPDGLLKKLLAERVATMTQTSPADLINQQSVPRGTPNRRSASRQPRPLPMTPIRRAISLLLQAPQLATSVSLDDLTDIQVKGIDLLTEFVTLCQSNPNLKMAALLERYRGQPTHDALEKLAFYDHMIANDQFADSFVAVIQQLKQQSSETELDVLLSKSKLESLSAEETDRLNELLSGKSRN